MGKKMMIRTILRIFNRFSLFPIGSNFRKWSPGLASSSQILAPHPLPLPVIRLPK